MTGGMSSKAAASMLLDVFRSRSVLVGLMTRPSALRLRDVEEYAEGDADTEDDVGKVADEQVAVGEEVGDVAATESGWGEQAVQEVADRAAP